MTAVLSVPTAGFLRLARALRDATPHSQRDPYKQGALGVVLAGPTPIGS
jgi:hypothetical protein